MYRDFDNNLIHPTAIIADTVKLGKDNIINPYVVIKDDTTIGNGNNIGIGCVIGTSPQTDKKEVGETVIGDYNILHEYVTIGHGTKHNSTRVGSFNHIFTNVHIAHDCTIGNHNKIINAVLLAGKSTIYDNTYIGANSSLANNVRIGNYSKLSAYSCIRKDVTPYTLVTNGYHAKPTSYNSDVKYLRFYEPNIENIAKKLFRLMYIINLPKEARLQVIRTNFGLDNIFVKEYYDFIKHSTLGILC